MKDHANKDWLRNTPSYRSSKLEWWLSGALLAMLLALVVVKYAHAQSLEEAHAYCKEVNKAWAKAKGFIK